MILHQIAFWGVVYHAFLWGLFGRKKRSLFPAKKGYKNEVSTVYCAVAKSITHFFTILYGVLRRSSVGISKGKSIFTH